MSKAQWRSKAALRELAATEQIVLGTPAASYMNRRAQIPRRGIYKRGGSAPLPAPELRGGLQRDQGGPFAASLRLFLLAEERAIPCPRRGIGKNISGG